MSICRACCAFSRCAPQTNCEARATTAVSEAPGPSAPAPAGTGATAAATACGPSAKRVCSTSWQATSSPAIPGSDRLRPASGRAAARTTRKPAIHVHQGGTAECAAAEAAEDART